VDITEFEPIGFYKSGRPIYPIMGGAGESDSSDDGQEDPPEDSAGDDDSSETENSDDTGEDDFDSLPDKTKAEIRQLRRDNRRLRQAAKGKSNGNGQEPDTGAVVLAELAKLLGVKNGSTQQQSQETDSDAQANEVKTAKVERALIRVAGTAGANPDALLDSRSFLEEIADLDPADPEFRKDLLESVKTAVRENPSLRIQGKKAPGKSGGDLGGGKGSVKLPENASPQQRLAAAYAANG
jgi:hypothetical protein